MVRFYVRRFQCSENTIFTISDLIGLQKCSFSSVIIKLVCRDAYIDLYTCTHTDKISLRFEIYFIDIYLRRRQVGIWKRTNMKPYLTGTVIKKELLKFARRNRISEFSFDTFFSSDTGAESRLSVFSCWSPRTTWPLLARAVTMMNFSNSILLLLARFWHWHMLPQSFQPLNLPWYSL